MEVTISARRNVPDLVMNKLLITPRFAATVSSGTAGVPASFMITRPKPQPAKVPVPVSPPCHSGTQE